MLLEHLLQLLQSLMFSHLKLQLALEVLEACLVKWRMLQLRLLCEFEVNGLS